MTRVPPDATERSDRHSASRNTTLEEGMSANEPQTASGDASAVTVHMNLEVHIVPVSDVDRAKEFYERLGWRLDDDAAPLDGLRIVQFTPPGSGTSVTFGKGLT